MKLFYKKLLYNIKWIGVIFSFYYGFLFIECASDNHGISNSEEYIMYTFYIAIILTTLLFKYKTKWHSLCDKFLNKLK